MTLIAIVFFVSSLVGCCCCCFVGRKQKDRATHCCADRPGKVIRSDIRPRKSPAYLTRRRTGLTPLRDVWLCCCSGCLRDLVPQSLLHSVRGIHFFSGCLPSLGAFQHFGDAEVCQSGHGNTPTPGFIVKRLQHQWR